MIYYGDTPAYQVHSYFNYTCYSSVKNAMIRVNQFKGYINRIIKDDITWKYYELKLKDGTKVVIGKLHMVEFVPKALAKVSLQMAVDSFKGDLEDFTNVEKQAKVLGLTIDDDGYLREETNGEN